ncbi:MAG: histidine kinase [Pedobacter sp.]|nr:histidine kinase [Pedobacter sp.]MDQ8054324.1 histidine kinase [Pedobacter sp.]
MLRSKVFPFILHALGWLLFMCLPLVFMSQGRSFSQFSEHTWSSYFLFVGIYLAVFYLNAYLLFPKLFLKRKFLSYSLAIVLIAMAIYYIKPFDTLMKSNVRKMGQLNGRDYLMPPPPPDAHFPLPPDHGESGPKQDFRPQPKDGQMHFDITSIFILITMVGLGTALQSIKQRQWYENRAILAEKERSNAELSFLKAQINPHFLYNTLNNIYTLSVTGSPEASESILKLSNIMRYVTDQAAADFVDLTEEIECTSNFVALQQLRLGEKVTLNFDVQGHAEGHKIAPLVLMTFVENVFKYGLSNHYASVIDILIKIKDKEISLYTNNQVFEHRNPEIRKGVGLENTKKRLKFLYPKQHTLSIKDEGGYFTVFLVLASK